MCKRPMGLLFADFATLCERLRVEPSHLGKTAIVREFVDGHQLTKNSSELLGVLELLLCAETLVTYRLKDRHLTKLVAKALELDPPTLQDAVSKSGDLPGVLQKAFESKYPEKPSSLLLVDVVSFLQRLSRTPSAEQGALVAQLVPARVTGLELRWLLALVQKDLKLFVGPRVVLSAIHPHAYQRYKRGSDLPELVRWLPTAPAVHQAAPEGESEEETDASSEQAEAPAEVCILRPVQPMLAQAVRDLQPLEAVWGRGDVVLMETKYDGERVQLHRAGSELAAFSRNLRALAPWKLAGLRDAVLAATAHCPSAVLDAELLAAEPRTGKPLAFGSLGSQRFAELAAAGQAQLQLVVFDALRLDPPGSLLWQPLSERRSLLQRLLLPQPGRVLLSPARELRNAAEVTAALEEAVAAKHEGIMLKPASGHYAPGARHWFKLKRDYIAGMADSADLVVLGAYRGKGARGGRPAAFLMGVLEPQARRWVTVCKLGSGFDAASLAQVAAAADLRELQRGAPLPEWLDAHRALRPDWVVADPARAPVLEVRAAELTPSPQHTAPAAAGPDKGGLSMRFPRLVRARPDRSAADCTSLLQLQRLARESMRPPLIPRTSAKSRSFCTSTSPSLLSALRSVRVPL